MSKTFKKALSPINAITKPVSERDFFDLTDDSIIGNQPVITGKKGEVAVVFANHPLGNTDNISNTENTGNNNARFNNNKLDASVAIEKASTDVRQTFVLSHNHLEQLRDYVHARRTQGDFYYSQKQALQEALELLFATGTPAPPRPAQAREREQQHRTRIQHGRRPSH